jgi:carbamoyltransferase
LTAALGFIPLRHEDKLTGLAAFGQPILADKITAWFFIDDSGRIYSDFRDYPKMVKFIHSIVKDVRREDAAASIQQVLEISTYRIKFCNHRPARGPKCCGILPNYLCIA